MDIDEFAKSTCQYAGKIDCSISGKSMLALYERIEIMEEDGIALTKKKLRTLLRRRLTEQRIRLSLRRLQVFFLLNMTETGSLY